MAEVFFESLKCSKLYIQKASVLGLYSEGITTGVSVDLGHSGTSVTAVYEGYSLPNASSWVKIGGEYLGKVLNDNMARRRDIYWDRER